MQGYSAVMLALCASLAVSQAQDSPPPGGIRLRDGFQHEAMMGLDTTVGRFFRAAGPEITYDIGRSSGHLAESIVSPRWTRTTSQNGMTLTLVMATDGDLYATYDRGPANFVARRLKSEGDLVDALLMILDYKPN